MGREAGQATPSAAAHEDQVIILHVVEALGESGALGNGAVFFIGRSSNVVMPNVGAVRRRGIHGLVFSTTRDPLLH
jgi:hypothetical protein